MSEVTVVIPTRNRLGLLQEAVASVECQTLSDVETIVVDDRSEDGTWEWLSGAPHIRPIRLDERGERSAARNVGLREARGRYVLFLDDDDRLTSSALERLAGALASSRSAVASIGAYVLFDESGQKRRELHPRRGFERSAWQDALFHWGGQMGRTLYRRHVVQSLGGFDPSLRFGEDWDLWLRATHKGPVVIVPDVVLEYRIHRDQRVIDDERERLDAIASAYVDSLRGRSRASAERTVAAWRLFVDGSEALTAFDARSAARCFSRSIRTDPNLLRSAIIRPLLMRPFAKALIGMATGARGTRALRSLSAFGRRITRRDVWVSPARMRSNEDATHRPDGRLQDETRTNG